MSVAGFQSTYFHAKFGILYKNAGQKHHDVNCTFLIIIRACLRWLLFWKYIPRCALKNWDEEFSLEKYHWTIIIIQNLKCCSGPSEIPEPKLVIKMTGYYHRTVWHPDAPDIRHLLQIAGETEVCQTDLVSFYRMIGIKLARDWSHEL